jgi:[protein-PII] uridylyltransferase
VEIQAVDRIGLLYAVFNTIGSLGLEITHARINTEKGAAVDSLCVTDAHGRRITDAAALATLRREVGKAAGVP